MDTATGQKKEKGSFIIFYILIGFIIGGLISIFYYEKLFELYLSKMREYIFENYKKTEIYLNKVVDQAVKLRKMLEENKVKYEKELFEKIFDTRSRILGSDNLEEKIDNISKIEDEYNKLLKFYNERMDLRNKRFGYVEWGMKTKEYIEEYAYFKNRYRDLVKEYNEKIKSFPLILVSKNKNFLSLPETVANTIIEPKTKLEKYVLEDLKDYKEEQDKPVEAVAEKGH